LLGHNFDRSLHLARSQYSSRDSGLTEGRCELASTTIAEEIARDPDVDEDRSGGVESEGEWDCRK
jgi:hypothetical protein